MRIYAFRKDLKYHLVIVHFYYRISKSITVNVLCDRTNPSSFIFPPKYSRYVSQTNEVPKSWPFPNNGRRK